MRHVSSLIKHSTALQDKQVSTARVLNPLFMWCRQLMQKGSGTTVGPAVPNCKEAPAWVAAFQDQLSYRLCFLAVGLALHSLHMLSPEFDPSL
jgi:hypothetical protein